MSSGAVLSTPREHLNNIENAIKATGLFAATAWIGFGAAGKAYPLWSLLTPLQDQRDDARWRKMAPDSGAAGGELFCGGFSCCCANGSWWWPRTLGGPVPRPHGDWKCACAPGWRCAPQGYPVRFRGRRGRIHFGPGTHEPDLVRFKFWRTRTGFGSVSAPMNQIIIKAVPQSTPFALPSHIMQPSVSGSVRMGIAGRGGAAPRARRGGTAP